MLLPREIIDGKMSIEDILNNFEMRCETETALVWVATIDGDVPHLAPVCFVKSLGEGRILIANIFVSKTVENIKAGSKVALGVSFMNNGRDGYLLKGKAEILEKGALFEDFYREIVEKTGGKRKPSSGILVKVEEIYSLKPYRGRKRLL
jgi:predicted pyridoxine 5'-phosphate oxidase superfamily flavin-nucleotide-binding protein